MGLIWITLIVQGKAIPLLVVEPHSPSAPTIGFRENEDGRAYSRIKIDHASRLKNDLFQLVVLLLLLEHLWICFAIATDPMTVMNNATPLTSLILTPQMLCLCQQLALLLAADLLAARIKIIHLPVFPYPDEMSISYRTYLDEYCFR